MTFLSNPIRARLRANADARRAAQADGRPEPDPAPVLKLFNPIGSATWLVSEMDADGDVVFGLADLGFGCPELGYFSLSEIVAVRLPWGLRIERDVHFTARFPLSVYAEAARMMGRTSEAEALLMTIARARDLAPPAIPRLRPARADEPRRSFGAYPDPARPSRKRPNGRGRFTPGSELQ
ncbi:DUF2958 domain-containing protein [Sphingomonas adhaesiva]|uniref:DUF2958 domain-containing protein n=1 Tax=Sphingomonas adhaesiva TaxID=28212 RepID=UPI002FFC6CCC